MLISELMKMSFLPMRLILCNHLCILSQNLRILQGPLLTGDLMVIRIFFNSSFDENYLGISKSFGSVFLKFGKTGEFDMGGGEVLKFSILIILGINI